MLNPELKSGLRSKRRSFFSGVMVVVLLMVAGRWVAGQQVAATAELSELPDAPQAQSSPRTTDAQQASTTGAHTEPQKKDCRAATKASADSQGSGPQAAGEQKNGKPGCPAKFDFFYPFGKPPGHGQPLTSKDKLRIAGSDVVDPFNLLTIAATSAITVGSDPNTGYGPGLKGWGKNSATLLTEDMTGAFFVTYLIPSIARQDPRYHRMPNASIPRRIENVIVQPVWARSDKGGHMPNYGMLIGVPASVALADIYVPGRKQGFWPIASTSAIAIASAPIDNVIDEFLPDVAKHVSVRIVLIQRIVNHLALTDGSS